MVENGIVVDAVDIQDFDLVLPAIAKYLEAPF